VVIVLLLARTALLVSFAPCWMGGKICLPVADVNGHWRKGFGAGAYYLDIEVCEAPFSTAPHGLQIFFEDCDISAPGVG
jgi:hypothetical protein